ncbi:hypothetical protein [Microlunatus parietis]|uniref:Uncharacterized protein n=1 Tax=Microlunatus parietis TaxID=682979 RepID=A0A7Y9IEJ8_9ACTN|nr:hypothetical protein [Microlunatus parietis]NYE75384.1 hypothetical protein [Microlunatus parietis]
MITHDHDPRETAIWVPGSLVFTRTEQCQHGLAAEEALFLRTLDQVQADRRRRPRPIARLRLFAARRLGVASLTD